MIQQLALVTGETIQPMQVKLRFYGEEFEVKVYSNILLEEFIGKVEGMTSIPAP